MNYICRTSYRTTTILFRQASSFSATDLKVKDQILKLAKAGCDLFVINSEIGLASGGTDAKVCNSKIQDVKAGTDLDISESKIGTARSGTDLNVHDNSTIESATAGTDAVVNDSIIEEWLKAGTSITISNSKVKNAKAGTSMEIANSEISGSAEAGCEANVKDSTVATLTCCIWHKEPMIVHSSKINELFLRTLTNNSISGDVVGGRVVSGDLVGGRVVSGDLVGGRVVSRDIVRGRGSVIIQGNSSFTYRGGLLFSYSKINGVRDFWILGIPVSKIYRFSKKILGKGVSAESTKPFIVILKDSQVNKITFDKKGGEVHLEGNSHVEVVGNGIVKKHN